MCEGHDEVSNHDVYLQACYFASFYEGEGLVRELATMQQHLQESCATCTADPLERPGFQEFKFLVKYLELLEENRRAITRKMRDVVELMKEKYGGKTPAELVSRYREAKAAKTTAA